MLKDAKLKPVPDFLGLGSRPRIPVPDLSLPDYTEYQPITLVCWTSLHSLIGIPDSPVREPAHPGLNDDTLICFLAIAPDGDAQCLQKMNYLN